jgi:hypothetical protein
LLLSESSSSLPPLYLIETATERLTIEEMLTPDGDKEREDFCDAVPSVTEEVEEDDGIEDYDGAEDQGRIEFNKLTKLCTS